MIEIGRQKLNELYWAKRLSSNRIGELYGVSGTTILNRMRELGIKIRKPAEYLKGHQMPEETRRKIAEAQLGERSVNWKGGRYVDNHGYMRVTVPPDSPFYPMAHKCTKRIRQRDITEHRLIMAQHLSRCLYPWEVVHHKNGDKLDNRIENLELMPSMTKHMTSMNYQRFIEQIKAEAKGELLGALKASGVEVTKNTLMITTPNSWKVDGWLVFIPDD